MARSFMEITQDYLAGIAQEIERLQALHTQVQALLEGASSLPSRSAIKPAVRAKRTGRRALSAEARERIAAAQRKRWAKQKGPAKKAGQKATTKKPVKKSPAKQSATAEA